MQKIPEGLNGSLSGNPYKPLGRNPLGRESRRCAERPKSRSHLAIDAARVGAGLRLRDAAKLRVCAFAPYGTLAMTVRFALRRQLSFGFLPRVFISR